MKRLCKLLTLTLLILSSLLCSFPVFADPSAPTPSVSDIPEMTRCKAAAVMNADTGELLFSFNETESVYPAASVKLMTALLILEHYQDKLDTPIPITEAGLADVSGVNAGLVAGETLTARQLLACIAVGSANDAACVMARVIGGSISGFVDLMNAKAQALGMTATLYKNATGLHHSKMVTTASDALILANALYRKSEFVALCSLATYTLPASNVAAKRTINNRNYMVSNRLISDYYDPEVNGMNYGSTYEAGGCVVASSESGGTAYLAVVFGGETETEVITPEKTTYDENGQPIVTPAVTKTTVHAFKEAKKLLDFAKKSHAYYLLATPSDIICEIPVRLGNGKSHVTLFPTEKIEVYLPANLDIAAHIRTEHVLKEESLTAPVMAGTIVGEYIVYYDGQEIARVDLTTRSTVDRSILGYYSDRAKEFLSSQAFRTGILIGIGIWTLYAVCMSVWRHHARKKAILRRRREKEEMRRRAEREKLEEWK